MGWCQSFHNLMIIHYFYCVRVSVQPFETNPPLLIDADAVLSLPIAFQRFQPVSRWHAQIFEANRRVQQLQLMKRLLLNVARQLPGILALPDFLGFNALKIDDQPRQSTFEDISVKRECWKTGIRSVTVGRTRPVLSAPGCGQGLATARLGQALPTTPLSLRYYLALRT